MRFNRNIFKTALCYLILLISYSYSFAQDSDDVIIDYKIVDRFEPPIPSINYLTETAIGLRKGELYYQNILLFGQKFGLGITDHFSMNMGFELYSIIDGRAPSILVAPKLTFNDREDPVRFGIGSNFVLISHFESDEILGSLYGLATFGNTDNHLTVGIGVGYDNDDIYKIPVLQVSGQLRLRDHFALVLDTLSLYNDEYGSQSCLLIRYMNKKFVFDIGGVVAIRGSTGMIPLANFAIRLN